MSVRFLFATLADSPAADHDLLAQFRRTRDEAAFAALVRRHGPMVWGVCRRVVGDAHTAEDAFQAAFLVLVMRADDAAQRGEVGGWLYGVAVRTALKARRAARRRAAREQTGAVPNRAAPPEPAADWLPVLDEELAALAEKYRLPVLLCDVQGMTLRAAAERLGVPVGTLSERLAKGRGTLAGRLTRRGVGPAAAAVWAVELPAGLAAATVQQAGLVACGGAVAPVAFGLSNGVARAMGFTKLKGLVAATVLVVAAGTAGLGGWRATAGPQPPGEKAVPAKPAADDWAARFAGLNDDNWRAAFALGGEVAALPPDQGWAVLRDNWPRVTNADARNQLVKAWYFHRTPDDRHHPHTLAVFHLSLTTPDPAGRDYANSYLKDVTLRDFVADGGFEEWYAANKDKPLGRAAADAAADAVRGLVAAPQAELPKKLKFAGEHLDRHFAEWPESRNAAADAGLVPFLRRVVAAGRRPPPPPAGQRFAKPPGANPGPEEMAALAVKLLAALRPTEADARADFLPLLAPEVSDAVRSAAVEALRRAGNTWAVGPLLDSLVAESARPDQKTLVWNLAGVLAGIGDPRAIPTMIAVIARDDTYDTVYGVGYFGLGKLTGVVYDEAHTGAWWTDWWARSKAKFPPAVRDLAIPDLPKLARKPAAADVPSLTRAVGDRRYLLVGPTAAPPAAGFKLLVVLPGGDGSDEFAPFVRDLRREALGDGWLVAQAVAESRVVWPTEKLNPPAEPTEKHLAAVVADAATAAKIDPAHVYLFGWSSGGPACYAALLKDGSPFRGAFVAMSVFKPDLLPPLAGAKGKAVYLLQSPDDKVTALRWAEAAEKELGAAGAKVKLQKYDGGHGWHGDVFGEIKAGAEWLAR